MYEIFFYLVSLNMHLPQNYRFANCRVNGWTIKAQKYHCQFTAADAGAAVTAAAVHWQSGYARTEQKEKNYQNQSILKMPIMVGIMRSS